MLLSFRCVALFVLNFFMQRVLSIQLKLLQLVKFETVILNLFQIFGGACYIYRKPVYIIQ